MVKLPLCRPCDSHNPRCDIRLPEAALKFRRTQHPPLTTLEYLGKVNVTAWLYRDQRGVEGIQVNPNTTIAELLQHYRPASTPDAEVGIHSEGKAAEWFRARRNLRVLQIFSERIPCPKMCAPMLRNYFPGVPWYYYYDWNTWRQGGKILKWPGEILKTVYGL